MRLPHDREVHLTYCSNIHPGEAWRQVFENLRNHVPTIKRAVAPGRPFGLGLRLSAQAAAELEEDDAFDALQAFLRDVDCYVFTLNGFPYGAFHGTSVKEQAYRPDWTTDARLAYTNRLARLLARLMPGDPELEGSISTVAGAYRRDIAEAADIQAIAERLVRHVAYLVDLKWHTGRTVVLGLEPEADCLLETTEDVLRFFAEFLHSDSAAALLSLLTGLSLPESFDALRRHLGICLDLCHVAVQFEPIADAIDRLDRARIRVVKVQVSACLVATDPDDSALDALRSLDDGVYLHQTVIRRSAELLRCPDLPPAIAAGMRVAEPAEWRIHLHVPICLDEFGPLRTTSRLILDFLDLQRERRICRHLEIETYTWSVLPEAYRDVPVAQSIVRELEWLLQRSVH